MIAGPDPQRETGGDVSPRHTRAGGGSPWLRVPPTSGLRARRRIGSLGVDENHPRPRSLYERLGYVASGREPGSWDEAAPDGSISRYETMITLMRKDLQ